MPRCALAAATVLLLASGMTSPSAQPTRPFPPTALRGELTVVQPPDVLLNGQPARLAPGSRIRGEHNMLVMSGAIVGQKHTVHYTVDSYGLLMDVWLLTAAERANKPWPATPQQAATWAFDPAAQRWLRP